MPGRFITFEGLDGAGKSTHLAWMARELRARGVPVITTREPGGTGFGENLRQWLLSEPMQDRSEVLLLFAARLEHVAQLIRPALARGEWVLCDRYTDATFAYQAGGRGVDWSDIEKLEQWCALPQPELTWYFDAAVELAAERMRGRALDRFEQLPADFHTRVRAAYWQRINADPQRFVVVDGAQSLEQIRLQLTAQMQARWFAGEAGAAGDVTASALAQLA